MSFDVDDPDLPSGPLLLFVAKISTIRLSSADGGLFMCSGLIVTGGRARPLLPRTWQAQCFVRRRRWRCSRPLRDGISYALADRQLHLRKHAAHHLSVDVGRNTLNSSCHIRVASRRASPAAPDTSLNIYAACPAPWNIGFHILIRSPSNVGELAPLLRTGRSIRL